MDRKRIGIRRNQDHLTEHLCKCGHKDYCDYEGCKGKVNVVCRDCNMTMFLKRDSDTWTRTEAFNRLFRRHP